MLLSVVRMYREGPPDLRYVNSTMEVRGTTGCMLLFRVPFR
jgi:hypothetical protein